MDDGLKIITTGVTELGNAAYETHVLVSAFHVLANSGDPEDVPVAEELASAIGRRSRLLAAFADQDRPPEPEAREGRSKKLGSRAYGRLKAERETANGAT